MGVIHNKMAIKRLRDGTAAAVADLQDQIDNLDPGGGLSVTVTDITADLEPLPEGAIVTLACIQTYGSIVLFTVEIDNPGQASAQEIYKIPANLVPYNVSTAIFEGDNCHLESVEGEFSVVGTIPGDDFCIYNLLWIANPAPAPEPGE